MSTVEADFSSWMELVAFHSADPDLRKPFDSTEFHKHFIDIDNYPEFLETGEISVDIDSLRFIHGEKFVDNQGILPWSTQAAIKGLTEAFKMSDFEKATFEASNLAHYVADGFMPLHISRNYDGQFSGNDGIHYRYESMMINHFVDEIQYENQTPAYIPNVEEFVFQYVYANHQLIDSLLWADKEARSINPDVTSNEYVEDLWSLTKSMTIHQFEKASQAVADLIYTCWVDAGKPAIDINYVNKQLSNETFSLEMVYFNSKVHSLNWIFRNNMNGEVTIEVKDSLNNVIFNNSKKYTKGVIEEIESIQLNKGLYTIELKSKNDKAEKSFKVY